MLSATSTTIKKHYNVLGFLKMGMYPISKKGFKTYHTFSIPTPTIGKKKGNQPKKKPQIKPHYPYSSCNETL